MGLGPPAGWRHLYTVAKQVCPRAPKAPGRGLGPLAKQPGSLRLLEGWCGRLGLLPPPGPRVSSHLPGRGAEALLNRGQEGLVPDSSLAPATPLAPAVGLAGQPRAIDRRWCSRRPSEWPVLTGCLALLQASLEGAVSPCGPCVGSIAPKLRSHSMQHCP